jgi:asparagine N-glycosylation enzyme membrane subunit Stt3
MRKALLFLAFCALSVTTCLAQSKSKKPARTKSVPYIIAKNYFVKNTFQQGMLASPKIESQQAFDEYFGTAVYMGDKGSPTKIDFNKKYVIAVIPQATDKAVELKPISLKRSGKTITFTYSYEEGEKQTYTSQPSLIVVVRRKHSGAIKVVRAK